MVSSLSGVGANQARQALAAAERKLTTSQTRIATGKRVSSAKDNGSTYSIATRMNSDVQAWKTVGDSLNRGQSILGVAATASENVQDILTKAKELALAYTDPSINDDQRKAIKSSIQQFVDQADRAVNFAEFDGVNLLNVPQSSATAIDLHPPAPVPIGFGNQGWSWWDSAPAVSGRIEIAWNNPASVAGSNPINYGAQTFSPPQVYLSGIPLNTPANPTVSFPFVGSSSMWLSMSAGGGSSIASIKFIPDGPQADHNEVVTNPEGERYALNDYDITKGGLGLDPLSDDPATLLYSVGQAISRVSDVGQSIGRQQNAVDGMAAQAVVQGGALETGVGNIADADLAREAAQLEAGKAQVQLSQTALAIANAAPKWVLSLFRRG